MQYLPVISGRFEKGFRVGKCLCHKEIETSFICLKDNVYLCEDCLKCRNPEIYCKFRQSCPIWFVEKHGKGWDAEEKDS